MAEQQDFWAFSPEENRPKQEERAGRKRGREDRSQRGNGRNKRVKLENGASAPVRGSSTNHQVFDPIDGRNASTVPWKHARSIVADLYGVRGARGGGHASFSSLPSHSPLLRLHEEILDFAAFMSPTPSEIVIAQQAFTVIRDLIVELFPGARVEVFGSRSNGLVLPSSDWDLVLFGVRPTSINMRKIAHEASKRKLVRKTEVIDSARVPIVKLWEAASGIQIDVSFEAVSGLTTRALIADFIKEYPVVRPLVLVLKYFLLQRALNETYTGGVGSFLLVLMVVHVVQRELAKRDAATKAAKQHQAGKSSSSSSGSSSASSSSSTLAVNGKESVSSSAGSSLPAKAGFSRGTSSSSASASASAGVSSSNLGPTIAHQTMPDGSVVFNDLNLGTLLVSFFELYGATLNYQTTGISVRGSHGGYFSKRARGWSDPMRPFLLSLENPVDSNTDVGKNSWGMQRVKRAFMWAHTTVSRALRAWTAAGGLSGSGSSSSSNSARMSSNANNVGHIPPPASLLGCIVQIDRLLSERAAELSAQRTEALLASVPDGLLSSAAASSAAAQAILDASESDSDSDVELVTGAAKVASSAAKAPPPQVQSSAAPAPSASAAAASSGAAATEAGTGSGSSAQEVTARAIASLEAMTAGSGIVLRHKRLLADVLTRKERNVEALNQPPPSWY
jgi:DNA polymerase sigma